MWMLVGFLKFLKREKKESFDELDLPPPPPLENMQPMQPSDFGENLPELDFPEIDENALAPKFEFPEDIEMPQQPQPANIPELPSFPSEGMADMQISPEAIQATPQPSAIPEVQQPEPAKKEEALEGYQRAEKGLFRQKPFLRKTDLKTIYVRVDRFKATLGSISMIRMDLRKSEEALLKLENIKIAKDKSCDRLRHSLDDLQRKLIFIDKTLFKGD